VALVRDFDRDSVTIRKRITEFLQYEPEVFYAAAIEVLKQDMDSRAAQYLVALFVHGNLLFRALSDPALDRERAIELARQAHRGDPSVDVKLARQLADTDTAGPTIGPGMAERLLEIVDRISDGKRILPSLIRMLRNDNAFLRSKVVLMIGRSGRSLSWIEKRLQETDTRVRANAIEALWGIDTPEARELLQWAARDTDNRVAGNALVGLYRLGEVSPLADLIRMACHDSSSFRRTAAWVMGRTGDPRFSEVLGRMIADSSATVRRSAFAAVRRVRKAASQIALATEWPVAIVASAENPGSGERRLSVGLVTPDGRGNPTVLPAQFVLSENGRPVWSYRVTEKLPPSPMSVVFLFPRKLDNSGKTWDQEDLRCLNWKRSADLWSVLPYSGTRDAPSARLADLRRPSSIASSAAAARSFQETTKRLDRTGFWTAAQRAVMSGNVPQRGHRHIIVLAPDEVSDNENDSLISAVQASRTSLQVLSTSMNPVLREFCRRVDGRFIYVKDSSAIEEAVSLAYLSLLARYDIRYRSDTPDATSLKLRVHTPDGWGETTVDL
jgi:hypothetical protein